MRKIILAVLAMAIGATCADAAVFRVTQKTIVKKHPNGVVQVIGCADTLKDINYLGQHCPDRLRAGCDDDIAIPFFKQDETSKWFQRDVEGMRRGQISFNFLNDKGLRTALWLGIPDCNVIPDGFIWEISKKDPDMPWSGGTQFTDLIPGYVPLHREVKWNELCGEPAKVAAPTPPSAPATVAKKYQRKTVNKQVPCPDGKGICNQTCIIEIREGVEILIESVGLPAKDEPVDERTLQQKARKTLDSLGQPDASDPADEKTVQQKTRKTLRNTEQIKKHVGESKSGKSIHDKLGDPKKDGETVMGMLRQIHQHVVPKDAKIEGKCNDCHIPGTSVPLNK